jgi:hypothetical protein
VVVGVVGVVVVVDVDVDVDVVDSAVVAVAAVAVVIAVDGLRNRAVVVVVVVVACFDCSVADACRHSWHREDALAETSVVIVRLRQQVDANCHRVMCFDALSAHYFAKVAAVSLVCAVVLDGFGEGVVPKSDADNQEGSVVASGVVDGSNVAGLSHFVNGRSVGCSCAEH